jgi:SAM-dependent methyltransferase
MPSLVREPVDVDAVMCRDRRDYEAALGGEDWARRWQFEQELAGRRLWPGQRIAVEGHCGVCRRAAVFKTKARCVRSGSERQSSGFRNGMVCGHCELLGRQRKLIEVVDGLRLAADATVYVCEQRSRFFSALKARFARRVFGSEYLGDGLAPGTDVRGTRHEDLEQLSFASASLDVVVCSDVLEHVADHRRALGELRRVVKPGGIVLLTVPFHGDRDHNTTRARRAGREIEHVLPPEHHVDPLSARGVLVFTDFGWELLRDCAAAGFADTNVALYWSRMAGHLGVPLQFFTLR